MKKNNLFAFLLLLFLSTSAGFAQSSDVMSAYTYLNNYISYKEDDYLNKAKTAIDDAINKMKTKGEDTVKGKSSAKAFLYKGQIYTELALKKQQGAALEAYNAFKKSKSLDDKGRFTDEIENGLFRITSVLYEAGFDFYKAANYKEGYNHFIKVLEIGDLDAKKTKSGAIDTTTIYAAALCADNAGMKDEAKKLYHQLMDVKYKDVAVFLSLSNIYRAEGDDAKANAILKQGREMFPDDKNLAIEEVNFLLKNGKQDEAIQKMEEAIKLDPKNASLHFALATAYDSKKLNDKAVESYQKSLEIDPKYFDALYNLGTLYYNQATEKNTEMNNVDFRDQKKYDALKAERDALFNKALPFFEQAYNVNNKDASTLIALKEIWAIKGDLKKSGEFKAQHEALK